LVRHAESEQHVSDITGGWTDTALTPEGIRQAECLAPRIAREFRGARVISSDLRRAADTAVLIAAALETEVLLEPGLREIDNGEAAGLTKAAAAALERPRTEPLEDWVPYPGAESWRDLATRIGATLAGLVDGAVGTLVIVSHGIAGDALIQSWLGIDVRPKLGLAFALGPTSVTVLGTNQWGERTLFRSNDVSHLG
jgi:probable phosphoglycerate mutase